MKEKKRDRREKSLTNFRPAEEKIRTKRRSQGISPQKNREIKRKETNDHKEMVMDVIINLEDDGLSEMNEFSSYEEIVIVKQ